MWKKFTAIAILTAVSQQWLCCGLNNGLALTPPMGFSTAQRFGCLIADDECEEFPDECISERLIKRIATAIVSKGYKDAGYEYIIVDECWLATERDPAGQLQPDPQRFPSGFKKLSEFLHSLGLKFGISQNYGEQTCFGFPGIKNHMELDAQTIAGWGIDYVKLNACDSEMDDINIAYPKFGQLLNATGHPIVYSCTWPVYLNSQNVKPNYDRIKQHCNLWSGLDNSYDSFESVRTTVNFYINNQNDIQVHGGPGHWNDADSMVIGNFGLSIDQSKYQMAMWAILAAPLIVSTDLEAIRPDFAEILLNKKIIEVNQDRLGIQGRHVKNQDDIDIWIRPITPVINGAYSYAVVFANNRTFWGPHTINVNLSELGLTHTNGYQITDLYDSLKSFDIIAPNDELKVRVNPSGVVMYTFIPQ